MAKCVVIGELYYYLKTIIIKKNLMAIFYSYLNNFKFPSSIRCISSYFIPWLILKPMPKICLLFYPSPI